MGNKKKEEKKGSWKVCPQCGKKGFRWRLEEYRIGNMTFRGDVGRCKYCGFIDHM